jgi:hypothetical protein
MSDPARRGSQRLDDLSPLLPLLGFPSSSCDCSILSASNCDRPAPLPRLHSALSLPVSRALETSYPRLRPSRRRALKTFRNSHLHPHVHLSRAEHAYSAAGAGDARRHDPTRLSSNRRPPPVIHTSSLVLLLVWLVGWIRLLKPRSRTPSARFEEAPEATGRSSPTRPTVNKLGRRASPLALVPQPAGRHGLRLAQDDPSFDTGFSSTVRRR